jgi:hypothetical protein
MVRALAEKTQTFQKIVLEYKQALAYPLLGYQILKNPEQPTIVAIAPTQRRDHRCSPPHARFLKNLGKRSNDTLHKCREREIRTEDVVQFVIQPSSVAFSFAACQASQKNS